MATHIRIIPANDLIKAKAEGELDFEGSKRLFKAIALAGAPLADYQILLDARKMQSRMSVTDLWYLAIELRNLLKPFSQKMALLYQLEPCDQAEFFTLCAKNRGFKIRAFTSFEDAIEWLISNER
jgi:hypothetical protein